MKTKLKQVNLKTITRRVAVVVVLLLLAVPAVAQTDLLTVDSIFTYRTRSVGPVRWSDDGSGYFALEASPTKKNFMDIVFYVAATGERRVAVSAEDLTPRTGAEPLLVEDFAFQKDGKVLIFTNSQRVWRSNTRGDYWVLDLGMTTWVVTGKDKNNNKMIAAQHGLF